MRIGLVLSSAPGYSETFFRNKILFLSDSGVEVLLFIDGTPNNEFDYETFEGFSGEGGRIKKISEVLSTTGRLISSPIKAFRLYKMNARDGFAFRKNLLSLLSSSHVLRHKLDWIHFGFATNALNRENLANVIDAKMAVSIRGYDITLYPLKNPNCFDLVWKCTDKLHYLSDDLLQRAINQGFSSEIDHMKITPAVDVNLFTGRTRKSLRTPLTIITVARLEWKKGIDYTLEALRALGSKGIRFNYVVIGDGTDGERLKFAAHQLGIEDSVRFLGRKRPDEIRAALINADLYLQYSVQEGFCNAVLEAQAMGLLCIVSDAGGLPENVLHGQTGWVVPKRRPDLLADRIRKVLQISDEECSSISSAARTRVCEDFSLKKQELEFLKFYGMETTNV